MQQLPATLTVPSTSASGGEPALRLGVELRPEADAPVVQWLLKRNCSSTPRQVVAGYLALCGLGTAIAAFFWCQGALLVAPFAGLELLAVGAALLVYTRHATDRECIVLRADRLTVERVDAGRVEQAEFVPAWVRIVPDEADRRLVELSAGGRRMAIGRHLRPGQRRLFVAELRWALRRLIPTFDPAGPAARPPHSEN